MHTGMLGFLLKHLLSLTALVATCCPKGNTILCMLHVISQGWFTFGWMSLQWSKPELKAPSSLIMIGTQRKLGLQCKYSNCCAFSFLINTSRFKANYHLFKLLMEHYPEVAAKILGVNATMLYNMETAVSFFIIQLQMIHTHSVMMQMSEGVHGGWSANTNTLKGAVVAYWLPGNAVLASVDKTKCGMAHKETAMALWPQKQAYSNECVLQTLPWFYSPWALSREQKLFKSGKKTIRSSAWPSYLFPNAKSCLREVFHGRIILSVHVYSISTPSFPDIHLSGCTNDFCQTKCWVLLIWELEDCQEKWKCSQESNGYDDIRNHSLCSYSGALSALISSQVVIETLAGLLCTQQWCRVWLHWFQQWFQLQHLLWEDHQVPQYEHGC